MEEFLFFALVSLVGLAAGFLDSLIGGGGLLSVPSLVLLGLPPQTAIATDRFGSIGQAIIATLKFWKAKKIVWKYVPSLCILSLVGSVIGASILLEINEKMLGNVLGIIMLVLLPLVFMNKDLGLKNKQTTKAKTIIGLFIFLLIAVFAGFYGQGTGPMVFYTLIFFIGLTMVEAIGTSVVGWLLLTISSSIIFALGGIINYKVGAVMMISMSIGSYLGASTAIKKGDRWVKRLFAVFVIILSIKLLFFNPT